MRFHTLQIKNLNSLYGDQSIDFEENFGRVPLFLIMGPTGSGKSTIMDAVSLALFGETPRQKGKSGTEVAEHVMTRGTGECEVVLEFSRLDPEEGRKRYRASWYCNRAYKKATGAMQTPNRSLNVLENGDWEVLANSQKIKEYENEFEEALAGMDLEDFLRSVLLAQGEFTAFLHADESTKADILEKLTRSEKYRKIGKRAFKRWQAVRDEVQELETRLDTVDLMEEEAFEELKVEVEGLDEAVKQKKGALDAKQTEVDWLEDLGERREAVKSAEDTLERAKEAIEEREDDFERLELAKKARPAAKHLRERDRLSEAFSDLNEEIGDLRDDVAELEDDAEEAKEKVDEDKEALEAATDALAEAKEPIEQAQKLGTRRDTKDEQRKTEKEKLAGDVERLDELETEVAKLEDEVEAATEARDEAKSTLDDLADAAELREQFGSLEAAVGTLGDERERVATLEKRRTKEKKALETATKERDELQEKVEEEREALEPLEDALRAAQEELDEHLGDAQSPAERRAELLEARDTALQKQQAAERAGEHLGELKTARQTVKKAETRLDELEEKQDDIDKALEQLTEKIENAEERVEVRQEARDNKRHLVGLGREREQLEDGEPCPVCGSPDHPWRDDGRDEEVFQREYDDAEKRLEEAKEQLEARREEREEKKRDKTRLQAEAKSARERRNDARDRVEALTGELDEAAELLGVEWDLQNLLDVTSKLATAGDEAKAQRKDVDAAREALQVAEDERDAAKDKLREAAEALSDLVTRRENKKKEIELLTGNLEQLDDDLEEARKTVRKTASALEETFGELDIEVDGDDQQAFERALGAAKNRRDAYEDAKTALEGSNERLEELQGALEKKEDAHKRLAKEIDDKKDEIGELDEEIEGLDAEIRELVGDRDPTEWREELDKNIAGAREQLEQHDAAYQKLREQLKAARAKLESKLEDKEKIDEQYKKAKARFEEELERLDFTDADALREAMMPESELEALDDELDELRTQKTRAEASLEDAKKALQKHVEDRPEGLDEDEAELEELEARVQELQEEYEALLDERGRKREAVTQQEELRRKQSDLHDKLEETQRDFRRWTTIKDLIGIQGGRSFKDFAQALNLERIVHLANQHLGQLQDRYRLAVARDEKQHPTLVFEVIDTKLQNRSRAISTLSGGETFLVSLALALALADFRQVRMPVETLLLDEGFGTLDQQSLSQAITTLKNLHAREERQVGLISHVEQLQEQIEYRIVVEKMGGGHSQIEVETP